MTPFRKILVPVDFSPQSSEALRFAADLSRRYDATLHVIHALHMSTYALPEGYVVPTPDQFSLVAAQLTSQLEAAKKDALEAGAVRVETELLQGRPTTEILRVAKEANADLIVMATHGRTGFQHMWLGSVAESVVRHASCPVLTTRAVH